ncbi:hypothetical protein IMCC12053_904 [Celeribacter marinus]|uniref:Uncharacterized protein n=1 Tax=Celeribacter marinus TaxID=1397108 RepID=A0A0P0A8Q2_9RHOB|nr:hypothetical protein IMCC12053_904 [Celeribacter marinus]
MCALTGGLFALTHWRGATNQGCTDAYRVNFSAAWGGMRMARL